MLWSTSGFCAHWYVKYPVEKSYLKEQNNRQQHTAWMLVVLPSLWSKDESFRMQHGPKSTRKQKAFGVCCLRNGFETFLTEAGAPTIEGRRGFNPLNICGEGAKPGRVGAWSVKITLCVPHPLLPLGGGRTHHVMLGPLKARGNPSSSDFRAFSWANLAVMGY